MSLRSDDPSSSTAPPRFSSRPLKMAPSVVLMIVFIALLHIVGWTTLLTVVVPLHLSVGSKVFGVGVGITAYTLGMRHAFDADHIAAIDNTTRKLVGEGKRSLSVGFWFSFGHSTIVFGLTLLLALGMRSISDHLLKDGSALQTFTGIIGTSISSGFLYLIAALNVVAFFDIYKVFRKMKTSQYDEAYLEKRLEARGVVNRLLSPLMRVVSKPRQMYFVGLLFGLGFDTATEIALLVLAGSGAASRLPWYATLCLPALFAAGMMLFDTLEGSFMNLAYEWAMAKPVRKIYYNLVVTGLSIAVAFAIGSVEILSLFTDVLNIRGAPWSWVSGIDLNGLGFAIVGLFVATWIVAVAIWKIGRVEEKWHSAHDHAFPKHEQSTIPVRIGGYTDSQ